MPVPLHHRLFTYSICGVPAEPQSWMISGLEWTFPAGPLLCGASSSVLLRHPRWGVPCVRPWEPYRLLDNEQPCDWNRTRELACLLSAVRRTMLGAAVSHPLDRTSWTVDGRAGIGDL